MKSIDERLAEVLSFLYEKNGITSDEVDREVPSILIRDNKDEILRIKDTIKYLKDYAKMKIVAQSIGSTDELKTNVDSAIGDLEKRIEEIKAKILELPAKKRMKVPSSNLFGYEEQIAQRKLKAIAEYNENLDKQKNALKDEIKAITGKIKELKSLRSDLNSPSRIMNRLFPNEQYENSKDYSRLIYQCASTLTSGFAGKELIGEDKVFTYDKENNQYSVNKKNARKLISTLKKKKDLIMATNYILGQKEFLKTSNMQRELSQKIEILKRAENFTNNKNIAFIHANMNEIAKMHHELSKAEYYDYEGNRFKRTVRGILRTMGLRGIADRPSRKVINKRYALEDLISKFVKDVHDNGLRQILDDYLSVRQLIPGQNNCTYDNLKIAMNNITHGFGRYDIPRETIELDDIKNFAKESIKQSQAELQEVQSVIDEENKKIAEASEGLSANAQKILKEYSPDVILDLTSKFYGDQAQKELNSNGKAVMTYSSALMILEGILGRKNISFDTLCDSYAGVLGKKNIDEAKADVDKVMKEKVQELQERIAKLTQIAESHTTEQNDSTSKKLNFLDIKPAPLTMEVKDDDIAI